MDTLSRQEVLEQLSAWQQRQLSAVAIHMWANENHMNDDLIFQDVIEGTDHSATAEVLAELSMLDMNLLIAEDVPLFKAFLNTDPKHFDEAYVTFVSALQNINREGRKRKLKNTEPYIKYCQ